MLEWLNMIMDLLNTYLYSYILVIALLGTGLIFTIKTGFIQFRWGDILSAFGDGMGHSKNNSESNINKISSFQAFAITTASRVGTGNLAGVAFAILVGGPGAVFWMWMTALLGGALSFVESVLAQIYKRHDDKGTHYNGGPAFYISKGLGSHKLAIFFSIMLFIVFGLGFNAVQVNTIADIFHTGLNIPVFNSGIGLTLLAAMFFIGGLRRIVVVISYIVPFMAFFYLGLCLIVIFLNLDKLGNVMLMIFQGAFNPKAFGVGSLIGTIIIGVRRGLFSNEAGMGSAPNAAAAAETSHPVKQGLVQAGGVFFDTIIICSATAFLILFSGIDLASARMSGASGIALTLQIFTQYFGNSGVFFLSLCVFLFAFSTVLGYFFYVVNAITFITKNKYVLMLMRFFVLIAIFWGATTASSLVWNITDFLMGIMALINIYAMWRLFPIALKVLRDYSRQRDDNKNPVFSKKSIPELEKLDCWD
ncbi:MAG: alanine/glycine:cation symporter family protein [Brevinema sp.]